jgi:hypothetical protein
MLDQSIAEIRLPGYSKCLIVDFNNQNHVAVKPLTTLSPSTGARGDIFLTPAYLFTYGIVPDADAVKFPESKGGSYAELWRAWAFFQVGDASGMVAESLRAIRSEVMGGALSACAASFAAGDLDCALAQIDGAIMEDSTAVQSARHLLAPGDRSDRRKVSAVLKSAVVGILAEAF